jgi:predicted site-specific integrase-resolvase
MEKWYTYKEIIEMLKISRQTLNNWRRNGNIIYKKLSSKTFLYQFPATNIIQENGLSKGV